jgi:hypothetical protein
LSFVIKDFGLLATICTTIIAIVEPFVKRKREENFYGIVEEFSENFEFYFQRKICFKRFKRTLKSRLIFLVFAMTSFLTFTKVVKKISFGKLSFEYFYYMVIYTIDIASTQLILYKFCFYVDFISLHLKALKEIVENFHIKSPSLKEVLTLKKLYILILEMSREFNGFMTNTIQSYITSTVLWLIMSNYLLLEIQFGELEEKGRKHGEKFLEN